MFSQNGEFLSRVGQFVPGHYQLRQVRHSLELQPNIKSHSGHIDIEI